MMKIFKKSPDGLTEASLRSRFYGLIKEGNKERVAPWFVKLAFALAASIVALVQIVSSFRPDFKRVVYATVGLPTANVSADEHLNVPLYNAARDRETSSNLGRQKNRPVPVERIQRINLSGLKGIPTGSEASAVLSSGGANGTVIAKLSENLSADGDILLPKGTILYGKGSSNDERLYVQFRKAILPDKTEQKIHAQAFDQKDRMVGLKGKKLSDVAFKIAASSGLIFLSGMADGMKQNMTTDIFGNHRPSVHDAALNGVATATAEQGKRMMDSMNKEEARVEVAVQTPIVVVFGDDSNSGE